MSRMDIESALDKVGDLVESCIEEEVNVYISTMKVSFHVSDRYGPCVEGYSQVFDRAVVFPLEQVLSNSDMALDPGVPQDYRDRLIKSLECVVKSLKEVK